MERRQRLTSTAGRPLASSRSTMQTTAATIMPASRAASNRVDGGSAGGADVVDDDDARAFPAETFNATAGAVGLLCFADEKAVEERSGRDSVWARQALAVATLETMGSAPMVSPPTASASMCVRFEQFEDGLAGETTAFGVERGGAAVDVVVAGAAGGELELAEFEAGAGEKREKLLGEGGLGHQERF